MRRSSAKELTLLVYKDILPGGAAYGKKVLVPAGCDRRHSAVAITHCGLEVRARSQGTVRGCPTVEKEINPTEVGEEGQGDREELPELWALSVAPTQRAVVLTSHTPSLSGGERQDVQEER